MPYEYRLELEGDAIDLQEAERCFRQFDPRIVRVDGTYVLRATKLVGLSDPNEIYEKAKPLVSQINHVMRLHDSSHNEIGILCVSFIDEHGNRRRQLFLAMHAIGRSRVTAHAELTSGSPLPARPSSPQRYLNLAMVMPEAMEVLELWNKQPRDGAILYKIYEIIHHHLGSDDRIANAGLATKADLRSFAGSVNRPDVTGTFARHAQMSGDPPTSAMTEASAEAFIGALATKWLAKAYDEKVLAGEIVETP